MSTAQEGNDMTATPQQYVATMKHHYRMADALAKYGKLADAAKALEAAEKCRVRARSLGAKV